MEKFNGHTELPDEVWIGNNPLNNTYYKTETTSRSRHGKVIRTKYHANHVINDLRERNAELVECLRMVTRELFDVGCELHNETNGEYDYTKIPSEAGIIIEKNGG
jgi:hypothetical protein